MPALSQNFTFIVDSTSTVQITYPVNTATGALVYTSEPLKGDGYFSNSDGLHTIQINLTEFKGAIDVYGTLASTPTENDWSVVKLEAPGGLASNRYMLDNNGFIILADANINYSITATTVSSVFNFVGNYVWVRSKVSNWTSGAITSIQLNH